MKWCIAGGYSNTGTADVNFHYFPEVENWSCLDRSCKPDEGQMGWSHQAQSNCFEQETSEFTREITVYQRSGYLTDKGEHESRSIPTLFSASNLKSSPKKSLPLANVKQIKAQH